MDKELKLRNYEKNGETLVHFSMSSIEVDEVYKKTINGVDTYHNLMFSLKDDGLDAYEEHSSFWATPDKDDYLDDTNGNICWDGAYQPVSYDYGEMDEESWIWRAEVVGVNDPYRIY